MSSTEEKDMQKLAEESLEGSQHTDVSDIENVTIIEGNKDLPSVDELQEELAKITAKAEDNWDKALRAASDLENYRKRAERDIEKAHKFAIEKFVKSLLPVIDSLEQAANIDDNEASEGLQLTLKLFLDTLSKNQVKEINPDGEAFDPSLHEAMSMIPQEGIEPGMIVSVFQKGYLLGDRVIRPARVVVSGAQK